MRELRCVLPPSGALSSHNRRFYGRGSTDRSRIWQDEALLHLRAAGFRPLPEDRYWLGLSIELYTCRMDVDNALKAALDAVAGALGVNDRQVGALDVRKYRVAHRKDQRLAVRTLIQPIATPAEFNRYTEFCTSRL